MKINNTAKRTIEILDLVSKNPEGLTLGEITAILDIPKTSVYDILVTLESLNAIEVADERLKSYVIGVKTFVIGNSYIQNADLIKISREILKGLGNKLGRTTFIAKESQKKIIYLYKYEPSNAIITTSNIGTLNEVYSTSLGKAIVAFRDDYEEYLNDITFKPISKNTITNKEDFITELIRVRQRGYSLDDREFDDMLSCVGAPIFNHNGKVEAAISAAGFYSDDLDIDYISHSVMKAAKQISEKLGYFR
jgi:DNA-binding IclR family transcriptional regulator